MSLGYSVGTYTAFLCAGWMWSWKIRAEISPCIWGNGRCSSRVTCCLAYMTLHLSPYFVQKMLRYFLHWALNCFRFSSIYHYDWNLFKDRFVGPDGATRLTWNISFILQTPIVSNQFSCVSVCVCVCELVCAQPCYPCVGTRVRSPSPGTGCILGFCSP